MNLLQVTEELKSAELLLKKYKNNVTIFGSARTSKEDNALIQATNLGRILSDKGFNILTGGGPGVMEAANKGAFEGKSVSIGLNIKLEHEQHPNPYLDEVILFNHFFTRKHSMMNYSVAFVCFPGGFGTGDELLEILTLIQTNKIAKVKVFLYGTEFWKPIITWFKDLEKIKFVNSDYLNYLYFVDSISQIVNEIEKE
jgi:hypothetical protein